MKRKAVIRIIGITALAAAMVAGTVGCTSGTKSQLSEIITEVKGGILDPYEVQIAEAGDGETYSYITVPEDLKGKITEADILSVSLLNKDLLEKAHKVMVEKIFYEDENGDISAAEDVPSNYDTDKIIPALNGSESTESGNNDKEEEKEDNKDKEDKAKAKDKDSLFDKEIKETGDEEETGGYIELTEKEYKALSKEEIAEYLQEMKDKGYDYFTIVIKKKTGKKYGITMKNGGDDDDVLDYGIISEDSFKVVESKGTVRISDGSLEYDGEATDLDNWEKDVLDKDSLETLKGDTVGAPVEDNENTGDGDTSDGTDSSDEGGSSDSGDDSGSEGADSSDAGDSSGSDSDSSGDSSSGSSSSSDSSSGGSSSDSSGGSSGSGDSGASSAPAAAPEPAPSDGGDAAE